MSIAKDQFFQKLETRFSNEGFEYKKSKNAFVKTVGEVQFTFRLALDGRGNLVCLLWYIFEVEYLPIRKSLRKMLNYSDLFHIKVHQKGTNNPQNYSLYDVQKAKLSSNEYWKLPYEERYPEHAIDTVVDYMMLGFEQDCRPAMQQWLEVDGKTYLFLAEFREGITVYNLTDKTHNSYLVEESNYQIIQYFPSPNGLKLATVQYGLQNLLVVVYDISKPMDLPYRTVYKKTIEDNNGKQVKTIDWNGDSINIVHDESVQICRHNIKVQVVGVTDDYFMGKCRFEDINGNEYFCYEKWEAMFSNLPDETTIFPIERDFSVGVEKMFTKNNQKIATISISIGYLVRETTMIDVFEHQVETYWFYQNLV